MAFRWGTYGWQTVLNAISDSADRYNSQLAAGDAAANARGRAMYAMNGEASLWGKVIPITWGNRRITGQLLQIGIQEQKTTRTPYNVIPNMGDVIYNGTDTWSSNVSYKTETAFVSTFAYVFGAPGNRAATQILKKLWFNGQLVYDVNQGFLSNSVRFRFYQGGEDQVPDTILNEARYQFPIAYRGLMYIVFYEYVQYGSSVQGNPVVEAEFAEQLTNTNTLTSYTMTGGPYSGTSYGNTIDAKKGIMYNIGNDGYIYKFRIADRQLISRVQITGTWPAGTVMTGLYIQTQVFVRLNGVPIIVISGSGSGHNSRAIGIVNADTGVTIDTLGTNNSSLTPTLTNILALDTIKDPVIVQGSTGQEAWMAGVTIFGAGYVFKITSTQITADHLFDRSWSVTEDALALPTGELLQPNGGDIYREDTLWWDGPHTRVNCMFYCKIDNTIVVMSEVGSDTNIWTITKLTLDAVPVVKWQVFSTNYPSTVRPPLVGSSIQWRASSNTADGQRIGWSTQLGKLIILDMVSGELTVLTSTTTIGEPGPWAYDAFTQRMMGPNSSGGIIRTSDIVFLNQVSGRMLLSTFLRNVAELQGYETANITVENINDQIDGAVITEKTDLDAMLEDIRKAYNFVIVKSGRFIKFTRRNYGSGFIVDGEYSDAQRAVLSENRDEVITVETEIATPTQSAGTVRLRYIDPLLQYTVAEFTHKRNDPMYDTSVELPINLPIIMQGSEAAALAARVLVDSNSNDTTHEFRLPHRYVAHEPGDVVTLTFPDYTDTVRMVEISYNGDFSLSIKSESIYTQEGPSYPINDPIIPPPPPDLLQGSGEPIIFDTTLIRYTDQSAQDAFEIYVSAVPADRLPVGGQNLVHHAVGGSEFQPVDTIDGVLTYGFLTTTLGTGWPLQVIYEDTISLTLSQGDGTKFATDTVVNMLAGKNRILVGNVGRWEHIGFIEASYSATTGIVTLTGIVRGLRGTEVYSGTHQTGDYAVLIETDTMLTIVEDASTFEDLISYAVSDSLGRVNLADAKGIQMMGMSRRPWAPANVHCVNSSDDVVITWQRRTRLNGPLLNLTPTVPLDETDERYQLILYRAGNAVRTLELTSPTFTYTAAMQTADGWVGSITQLQLDVTQVSSLVGPGFIKTGTYDVE